MTVIAWDGKTLAADKRASMGGLHRTVTKIHRMGGGASFLGIVGLAGDLAYCREMLAWLMDGEKAAGFPAIQRDREKFAAAIVIRGDGTVWKYEDTPHPYQVEDMHFAIGSGRDYAMAAMHLGKTASEAVAVAMALDTSCGNGIDTLELEEPGRAGVPPPAEAKQAG